MQETYQVPAQPQPPPMVLPPAVEELLTQHVAFLEQQGDGFLDLHLLVHEHVCLHRIY